MNEVSVIMTLLVIYLIAILAGIAVNVLLALAAYQDARARGNQNATMWGVLIGILGWIPGIIYLCTRNSARKQMMACPNCGAWHPVSVPNCPQCGVYNTYSYPFCNPETQVAARKAKRFLIAAIIVFGSAIILLILSIILFAVMMAYAV